MRISDWSSDVCSSDLDVDQAQDDGIEIFVHEFGALGAVRRLRAEGPVILPPLAALNIEVEVGVEEGVERALDGGLPLCGAVIIVERLHPLFDGDDRAPCDDGVEQRLLVVAIIIDQRVMDEIGSALCRERVVQYW